MEKIGAQTHSPLLAALRVWAHGAQRVGEFLIAAAQSSPAVPLAEASDGPAGYNRRVTLVRDSIAARASREWLALVALLLIVLPIIYSQSLAGGFIWDDDYYVWQNPLLGNAAGLATIWLGILIDGPLRYALPQYYPLTHTSFWIEHALWGTWPVGYRLTNLALHAATSLLAYRILRRLDVRGAFFAAVLFAIHPLHVESVAWITERKNVLSAALGLAAFACWLRWRFDGHTRRYYAIGAVLFAMALCAKSTAATLAPAMLVVIWWKTGRLARRDWIAFVPLVALGAGYGSLTAYMEVHRVGAQGPEWEFAPTAIGQLGARIQLAGAAVAFYASKLVVPWPLMFSYPRVPPDPMRWLGYVAPVLAALTLGVLWLARHRLGRGPIAALLCFVGILFPALGFSNVYPMRYSFVADHFCYVASLPFLALGVATVARLPRLAGLALGASVVVAFGALTFRHAAVFRDAETVWLDTLAKNPRSWIAMNNLGLIHMERGEQAAARALFEHLLADVRPDHREAKLNLAELDRQAGDVVGATARLEGLLATDPTYGAAWHARGKLHESLGDLDAAAADYARAVAQDRAEVSPMARVAHARMLLRAAGQADHADERSRLLAEAETQLVEALRLAPSMAVGHVVRAQVALALPGGIVVARRSLDAAERAEPGRTDVANTFAQLDLQSGDVAGAERRLRAIIASHPDAFEPTLNLAALSLATARFDEAAEWLDRAESIRPGDPRVAALRTRLPGR